MNNANIEDIYELSPLQQGLLLHSMLDGAADMYLSQQTYSVDGPLDTEALVRGWQAVAATHAVLRTSFHWQGMDKPLQVVHRDVSLPVHRHDWSDLDDERQRERLRLLHNQDRAVGFDPEVPPLQRLHVIRLGDSRHKLMWTYHHVLMDGWSVPNFLDEVMAQYRSLTLGTPPPPSVPAYRDYIAWLQSQDLREARDFWTTTLANVSPCHVTRFGLADPRRGTGPVDRRTVSLPAALTDGLRQAAARHRVTFNTMLQAVWAIVLQVYISQPEIIFGCVTSGRPAELPQVDRMVGLFANTLPLRVTVPDDGDLGSWLRELQSTSAAMRRYEYTPLAEIKKHAGVPGQQLFDSLLVLENYSLTIDASMGPSTEAEPLRLRVDSLYDKIDLPLTLTVAPDPVSEMQLLIHRDRFEPGFLDDILKRVHLTLEALIAAERIAPVVSAAGPRPVRPSEPIPAPARERPSTPTPPATPEEEAIAAVYREILGVANIDVAVSFFELGGDALGAVRAVSRIDGASVGMLTAHPSVRELARALADSADNEPESDLDDEIAELEQLLAAKRAAKAQRARPDRVVPVARDGALPCTHQQDGLWFLHQLDPTSTVYHVTHALRLHGALDVPALERAITALVVRHEALRTRFVERDGLPHQVIEPPPTTLALPVTEVGAEQVGQWAACEAHRPFDLATGPLFRAALARLAPDEHALVLVAHHIAADGWSAGILAEELAVLYGGGEAQLPPLVVQAADHAVWQRSWLDDAELDRQLTYWREALADLPTVDFPTDRPRPAQPIGVGATITQHLPDDLATAARAYAQADRVSFLAVLQAALLTVLHGYTGQDDLAIGSVFSGRTQAEIEPVVGFFANTLVLRTDVGGRPSFAELVNRCHATVLNATGRQDVPFGLVVDTLQPERVAGRNPLFQIGLMLLPGSAQADITLGDVAGEPIEIVDSYSRFDILINVVDVGGQLDLLVEYSTEMFDADRIERLLDHYTVALANGLAAPETPADDLDIMSAAERTQVLHTWNDTAVGGQAELVHRLFEAAAERTPEAVALIDHDGVAWTYRQLDVEASQLAHRLRRHRVGPDAAVGICLDRGVDLVTSLVATLKAGGGCLPLEPGLPAERLAFILADASPAVVITQSHHLSAITAAIKPDAEWDTIVLDTERDALAAEPTTAPDSDVTVDSLACLLYTAGGTPTGVLVSHRGVRKQLDWMRDTFRLEPSDRVLLAAPYSLGISLWESFWPLAVGAALVVTAPGGQRDPEDLYSLIVREGVTTAHFVPTTLLAVLEATRDGHDTDALRGLRRVFTSGEELPPAAARQFLATWPNVELHHLYGHAEASIAVTAWRHEPDAAAVPVGTPIANMRTYVLDGRLRPVPIGVPGHLFIGGPVAHGYLNRPGLTAERFLPDPYANRTGQRMYASGDLARWRSNGVIEYLGRTGRQVNLQGQGTAALPDPAPPIREYVPPRTDTERWLAAQWQELLGVEPVGAQDNFFDLGANSLHATQLFARIREGLRIQLEPRHMFTSQVLEQLAVRLDESDRATDVGAIVPVARGDALPCTYQQESLWFIHQLDPTSAVYHLPFALRLHGAVDISALERTILALISRHEALRTRFIEVDDLPRQVIDPVQADFSLPMTDLAVDGVTQWAADQILRPFDLAAGPLFRAAAARLAPDEYALVLVVHHIIADGMSVRIMADEFSQLYAAEADSGEARLAPLHVQPADHAAWQRARLDNAELARQVAYWRAALADLTTVDFPTDRLRPAWPAGTGASFNREIPNDVATAARDFARSNQVSFLAVMQAALLTVLHRYTRQDDLTIGSTFSGRTHPEIEPVVGFFANTVVLRTDVAGKPSFAELVRRCHDTIMAATERQDAPFALIVDAVRPDRVLGRNPLFQISLTLQPAATQPDLALGDVTAEPIEFPGDYAQFDIGLDIIDGTDRLDLAVEYSTELFDADRIERLLDHYTTALACGLTAPDIPANELDIMSTAETHRVLHVFNMTPTGGRPS